MGTKGKLALYGGLFFSALSMGSCMTSFASSYVRMSRYQNYAQEQLNQLVEQCNEYQEANRDRPETNLPSITYRQNGAVSIIYPEEYCPAKQQELQQDIEEFRKEKFNPFNIWK